MNNYSEYKETNLNWMPKIPSSWKLTKNRYYFKHKKNKINESEETPVLSLTTKGIRLKKNLSYGKSTESYVGHQIVEIGDIVFTPRDFDQTPILSDVSNYEGCISNLYIVDETKNDILSSFVNYYWYGLKYLCDYFKNFSHGMRYSFNRFQFDEINLLVPPLEEQQLITRYLDKKTEQIDSMIGKIQKKIELLKEQRTSLINQFVTKGLDPNVEMKDSGVEWIGEIPSHWDYKKLKYISKITYGISPQETTYNDEGIGTVLINGPVEYSITDFGYTRSIKWTTDPKNIVPKGSLLFCVRGSTTGRMNICHQDVSIGRGVCSIESKLDQDFTIFSMMMVRIYIQDQISGSTFPSVVKEDVDNFVLPCPPIEEQQLISKYITDEVEVIDKLTNLHSKKNDILREYRQSLISSVVTGKVRVTEDMI